MNENLETLRPEERELLQILVAAGYTLEEKPVSHGLTRMFLVLKGEWYVTDLEFPV